MERFESSALMFISNHQVQLRNLVFDIISELGQKFLVISSSVFQTSDNTVGENLITDILSQAKNDLIKKEIGGLFTRRQSYHNWSL